MKNAEDYFKKYGNRHLMIDYSSLSKIITDHDQELISEIEKKMPKEYTSKYVDEHWANAEVMQALAVRGALTEIINLIKEK